MVEYLDIQQYRDRNPNKYDRKPFTKKEVSTVWKWNDTNEHISIILMMIYTGVRVSELLDLKKENVNLEERYFEVIESKTEAGIRTVPIAEKIVPLFEYWMTKNDCEYVLSTPDNEHFLYRSTWFLLETTDTTNGTSLTNHMTQDTCVSMLTVAGVDDKIIKKIVGHKDKVSLNRVYTFWNHRIDWNNQQNIGRFSWYGKETSETTEKNQRNKILMIKSFWIYPKGQKTNWRTSVQQLESVSMNISTD